MLKRKAPSNEPVIIVRRSTAFILLVLAGLAAKGAASTNFLNGYVAGVKDATKDALR